jgi:hypothetical protein
LLRRLDQAFGQQDGGLVVAIDPPLGFDVLTAWRPERFL